MLKTKVKVNNITNLSDARYCAGMGVDYLSFPTASVDPKTFQEITGWIAGPQFGIETDNIENNLYNAGYFEISVDQASSISTTKLFVRLHLNEWFEKKQTLLQLKEKIIAIELEIRSLEDSKKIVEEIEKEFDVFIRMDSNSDIESILKLQVAGISLEGNQETKPGLKEYPLSDILEKLEIE